MTFDAFTDLTHEEIQDILIKHLHDCRDRLNENKALLACDSRSVSLKNRGRELTAALTEIESLLDDLGIDPDEI